jgi:hypothetical protein
MKHKETKRRELARDAFETEEGILMPETKIVFTTVKFDFMEDEIEIAHFNPQSEKDIAQGISNRSISEQRKLGLIK